MVKNTTKNHCHTSFDENTIKDDLVLAILKHAKFDGFGMESLILGAKDMGLSLDNANAMFPNPDHDILTHWLVMLDAQTMQYGMTLDRKMRIRDKISTLVKNRFKDISQHKVALKAVFASMAMPFASIGALQGLYATADTMWLSIGDTTPNTDRNYYTKRGILSAVLFCSIGFYLQDDESDDDVGDDTVGDDDTDMERYIDDRIDNALQLGKFKSIKDLEDFKQYLPYMSHPLKMRD